MGWSVLGGLAVGFGRRHGGVLTSNLATPIIGTIVNASCGFVSI